MRRSPTNSEENELDKLVLDEFDKVEKAIINRRPQPEEKIPLEKDESSDKLAQDAGRKIISPLSQDEEKFVASAVAWLKPNKNKEIILDRIWELLVKSEPDAFFSPEKKPEMERPVDLKPPEAETKSEKEPGENK